jgi:hypothetical protein
MMTSNNLREIATERERYQQATAQQQSRLTTEGSNVSSQTTQVHAAAPNAAAQTVQGVDSQLTFREFAARERENFSRQEHRNKHSTHSNSNSNSNSRHKNKHKHSDKLVNHPCLHNICLLIK